MTFGVFIYISRKIGKKLEALMIRREALQNKATRITRELLDGGKVDDPLHRGAKALQDELEQLNAAFKTASERATELRKIAKDEETAAGMMGQMRRGFLPVYHPDVKKVTAINTRSL